MSEEIKGILDRLERIDHKEYSGGFEFADSSSFNEDCRCFEERKKLANYITNLQKENKHLDKVNCKLRKKINNDVYKSRNEKAIEYIEKCRNYHRDIHNEEKIFPDEIASLLMILRRY